MGDVRDPDRDQMAPIPNHRPSAHDLVAADLMERKDYGLRKYSSLLQAGNGRDALKDAYEEVQDLIVYLRTAIEERNEGIEFVWSLLDRNPVLAVNCILSQAPITAQMLQVVILRSYAAQLADMEEDEESVAAGIKPKVLAAMLQDSAEQINTLVAAELSLAMQNPDEPAPEEPQPESTTE